MTGAKTSTDERKYGVKVNGHWTVLLRYLINTLLSQQMSDAIKHLVVNVFQQDTAPVCNQQGLYQLGVRCHRNVGQ